MPPEVFVLINNAIAGSSPIFQTAIEVIKTWWWAALPFFLWNPLKFMWLWWRQNLWDAKQQKSIIEIKIPQESLKPVRAMETVLNGMWQIYAPTNWYEKWWGGEFLTKFSFEIVSLEGTPHFFIRVPEKSRGVVESHIYSQYPEAEISVVEDYVKKVPQDMPNKEWEMWGTDYKLIKPDAYPIRTYTEFETERETEEEKRIDPLAGLLEGMTKLKEGEQLWVQIIAKPVLGDPKEGEYPWKEEAKKMRDKLARRKAAPESKLMLSEMWDLLVHGTPPGGTVKEEKDIFPAELKLTPGERDVVAAIENKMGKLGFDTCIRYIYLGKRDAFFGGNIRVAMSYFVNFLSANLNGPVPWGETITKTKQNWWDWFWFIKRRTYMKKRRLFWHYAMRLSPKFPLSGGTFILNSEELATIYHFPSRAVAPAPFVPRVEAKKGEAPANLPIE